MLRKFGVKAVCILWNKSIHLHLITIYSMENITFSSLLGPKVFCLLRWDYWSLTKKNYIIVYIKRISSTLINIFHSISVAVGFIKILIKCTLILIFVNWPVSFSMGDPKWYDFLFPSQFFQNFRLPPIVIIDFRFRVDPNLLSYQCWNLQCNAPKYLKQIKFV